MDNGEDWQKPNTFGEAALRSLEGVLDQLALARLARAAPHRQALRLRGRRGHRRVRRDHAGARAARRRGRPRALRPHPRAAVRHGRGDQRRCRRRWRRDRAALRLPHDRVLGTALRLPGGVPRPHPRLGGHAARPAAGRSRAGGDVHRGEPAPPEPHARRANRHSRPGMRTRCSSPSSSSTSRSRSCSTRSRRVRGKRRPAADLSDVAEVCRKARSRLDGQVHGATPAPYRALDLIEGAADLVARRGLSRRGGRARGAPPRARGPGLRLRVRPRGAPREARRGHAGRRAEARAASRRRRRGAHGEAARTPLPETARGPGRAPRPHPGAGRRGDHVDPGRARRAGPPRPARRGQGAVPRLARLRRHGMGRVRGLRPRARSRIRGDGREEGGLRRARARRVRRVRPRDQHVLALGDADGRRPRTS